MVAFWLVLLWATGLDRDILVWCHGGLFEEDDDGRARDVLLRAQDFNDGRW